RSFGKVENYLTLHRLAPHLPVIPVVQGWRLADYLLRTTTEPETPLPCEKPQALPKLGWEYRQRHDVALFKVESSNGRWPTVEVAGKDADHPASAHLYRGGTGEPPHWLGTCHDDEDVFDRTLNHILKCSSNAAFVADSPPDYPELGAGIGKRTCGLGV